MIGYNDVPLKALVDMEFAVEVIDELQGLQPFAETCFASLWYRGSSSFIMLKYRIIYP